jgi:p-cymene monooxygenase
MNDYLKYYAPVALQLATAAGFIAGGYWVYVGIASFPLMALIDTLLPNDTAPRHLKSRFWANIPVWMCTLFGPALYLVCAWSISRGDLTSWQLVGCILSLGWLSVIPLVPAAHELYHQRGARARFFGQYALVACLDSTRLIAHVVGHHIYVATPKDGDTATRGTSLYTFTPRAVVVSSKESWNVESDALEKRGKGRWSLGHALYKAMLALIIFQVIIFMLGGWTAVLVSFGGMCLARLWEESFNYFQHYGLVRVEGAPIEKRHVWNHLGTLTRVMGFEITNHADHHLDTYLPFDKLVPDTNSIKMPSVFVCFLSALIPPLWHNVIIKPALKDWDQKFANLEEQKLARAQNDTAHWPNWFQSKGQYKSPTSEVSAA